MKTTFTLQTLGWMTAHLIFAASAILWFSLSSDPRVALIATLTYLFAYLIVVRRLDYMDCLVVFLLPWLFVVVFSLVPLSEYAVPIKRETYLLILLSAFTALVAAGPKIVMSTPRLKWVDLVPGTIRSGLVLFLLDSVFLLITILNIALAGYVPLIQGFTTGDTGYLDFGVHGLYGFYLAFANALAIFYLVLYLRTRNKWFLTRYLFVIFIFVAFVTRQNLISLAVESVIVYSILRQRVNWKRILIILIIASVGFSVIGSYRSGSIKEIASIPNQYSWVPEPVIWVYAYSYFNLANLDSLLRNSNAPYYNGSSFANLIPSFLRPDYEMGTYLEVAEFNATSYLTPVYQDIGTIGVIVMTFFFIRWTTRQYRNIYTRASLYRLGTFAVLYFCAAFSFFVNFWFFLPVIFQIVFFKLLSNLTERVVVDQKRERRFRASPAVPHSVGTTS